MPCVIGAGASLRPLRFCLGALVVLLLAGCTVPPPVSFRSPLAVPEQLHRLYVPGVFGSPNKLGLAGCGSCVTLGCAWCYSWSPWPGSSAGVERVPMIRDKTNVSVTQLGGNSDWLMGFNEPDLCPEQACLTPAEAAVLWREIETRWPDKRLVAPAPSHLHPEWLVQWYLAYQERYGQAPRIDALAMHCYWRTADDCITLAQEFEGLAEIWGIQEGWVTEFAFTQTTANWQAQIRQFTESLERSAFWTRYAPFVSHIPCSADDVYWNCAASGDPSLLTTFGQLTDIGRMYQRATE
jgi:hypothetical protein